MNERPQVQGSGGSGRWIVSLGKMLIRVPQRDRQYWEAEYAESSSPINRQSRDESFLWVSEEGGVHVVRLAEF